jgi:hypothetical protein
MDQDVSAVIAAENPGYVGIRVRNGSNGGWISPRFSIPFAVHVITAENPGYMGIRVRNGSKIGVQ